jgi:hypothetical protein
MLVEALGAGGGEEAGGGAGGGEAVADGGELVGASGAALAASLLGVPRDMHPARAKSSARRLCAIDILLRGVSQCPSFEATAEEFS